MGLHNWFLTTVRYEKTAEEGKIVTVSETNLVDALSFTEAEERIIKEMTPFISGQFVVASCRRAKINEIFYNENGDYWFKAKVAYISLDEEKGIEKRTVVSMLVQATDIDEACKTLKDGMKGSMADYRVLSMAETPIMDIYKYETETENKADTKQNLCDTCTSGCGDCSGSDIEYGDGVGKDNVIRCSDYDKE